MTEPRPTSLDETGHERLTRRYEQLRNAMAARPRQPGSGLGEVIVVRRGLAAWLESSAATGMPVEPRQPKEDLDPPSRSSDVHPELLSVLVNLVLRGRAAQEPCP